MVGLAHWAGAAEARRFQFGPDGVGDGKWISVASATEYTKELGYGFEPAFPVHGQPATAEKAFFFSSDVPEGNYRVTVTLAGGEHGSTTTIKAELRRLMIERFHVDAGQSAKVDFIVNVRTPPIAAQNGIAAGAVKLKKPRESTQEAWAWDGRLTLEFNGNNPAVSAIEIEPVDVPTIFLLGDSTVCDQSREPFTSWGQMFTRFFADRVAIANHGESGETYRDSLGRRRIDKIVSLLRPGDWVLLQFGHNDQKQIAANNGGPFTTYKEEIKRHVAMVRQGGGVPVIVSPMERRNFDEHGKVKPSLSDYAEAARQAAEEAKAALIDLNALSKPFYETLGPEKSAEAFAAPEGKVDNTHHNAYGAYELAWGIATAARKQQLGFAKYLVPAFMDFDPLHPDDPAEFAIPPSPLVTNTRPLGD